MRYLLVDALNNFLRNWAAVPASTDNGVPVGGVVGFIRSLKSWIRDLSPDRAICVWDGKGGSQRRRGIYADYKAGRKPRVNRNVDEGGVDESRANITFQYAKLCQYLELLGIGQVEASGIEADDAIAYLANHVLGGSDVTVVSTDKDFLQLVSDRVTVFSPTKRIMYTPAAVLAEHGVAAENFLYLKALVGDGSDNIGGIRGIGPKTALKLFPRLAVTGSYASACDLLAEAEHLGQSNHRYGAPLGERGVYIQNVQLMQLFSPIISAEAARTVREQALAPVPQPTMSAFKIALLRDGITMTDSDIFSAFESYHARARRP